MTVDLHVREAGSGLPVVLLHAFPLSSAMWLEQRNALGERSGSITPDLRGFGGSPLGWDEPSLDHGRRRRGRAARQARPRPRRAGRAVDGRLRRDGVPAPPPGPGPRAGARRHQGGRGHAGGCARQPASGSPPRWTTTGSSTRCCSTTCCRRCSEPRPCRERPLVHGRVAGLVEAAPPAAAAWAQRAMAGRPDSLDTLRATDVPALVVWGEEDALASRADARRWSTRCRRAGSWCSPRSGHLTRGRGPGDVRRRRGARSWRRSPSRAQTWSIRGIATCRSTSSTAAAIGDREQRADDAEQRAAEQHGDHGDRCGHVDRAAHHPRVDRRSSRTAGRRRRRRRRRCPRTSDWVKPSSDTTTAAMVAPTSGIRSRRRDEHGQRQCVGQPDDQQEDVRREAGDEGDGQRAADEAADPVDDLVAEQGHPLAPGRRDQPVGLALHARQRRQEVERHDEQREGAEHGAEHDPADPDDAAEQARARGRRTVDVGLGPVDHAVVVVELADGRGSCAGRRGSSAAP